MSSFKLKPVFVPHDINNFKIDEGGLHNAWAVFENDEIKYCFEFEDSNEEVSQRANAERMLEWCLRGGLHRESSLG
jgi:hypothetical protein